MACRTSSALLVREMPVDDFSGEQAESKLRPRNEPGAAHRRLSRSDNVRYRSQRILPTGFPLANLRFGPVEPIPPTGTELDRKYESVLG